MDEELGWEEDLYDNGEAKSVTSEEHNEDDEAALTNNRFSSQHSASDSQYMSWPQSYKQSMDLLMSMKPPVDDTLERRSLATSSSSSSFYRRQNTSLFDSALCASLLPNSYLGNEDFPSPLKISAEKICCHEQSPNQQCSFTQSVLNGMNVLCGVGILSVPYAVKGGWMGLAILFLFGVISCYTGILLKRCLDSSPEVQTYPDIGEAAFGKIGRLAVAIVLYVELYASCVEYITLMSDNLSSVFPNVHLSFCGIYLNANYVFSIIATITVLPTVWLRNLSFLSYLSAGGVVASIVVVVSLLWVGVVDQVGFHPSGTAIDFSNLPIAIGLYAVCYTGHSVFPNIYTSMEKPSQFPAVLIVCFTICWLLYTGVAICGFMMFGSSMRSQFTLNMPHQFLASKIAVWTTVVNPMTKYALTITPVALSLEELLPASKQKSYLLSGLIRTLLVFSTLIVALTVPFFGLVMALIGSFSTMLVALIFPCACYLMLNRRLSCLEVGICISIIIVGLVCCLVGSYSAIMKIVNELYHSN
ncbi:hypothetical protein ACHQM5_010325 [Ranunculus cassubicifolius]